VDSYWFTNGPKGGVTHHHSELDWNRNLVKQLESRNVEVVLDVGANSGQYAAGLRAGDFQGRIVSFEPLAGPFSMLERTVSRDPVWDCHRCALGDFDGTISMNVSGGTGECSSILPMLDSHSDVFPPGNYVGTEDVTIHRLDAVAPDILRPNDAVFLKIDVQGFEKQVIAGGESTVRDRCVGMQIELSFVPLYEGGMLLDEALDLVHSFGFTMTGFAPVFFDIRAGRLLQGDGVFFRVDAG
jgi:FkbM family methyltransferase